MGRKSGQEVSSSYCKDNPILDNWRNAQAQARHKAPEFDKQQLQQTTVTGMEPNAEPNEEQQAIIREAQQAQKAQKANRTINSGSL